MCPVSPENAHGILLFVLCTPSKGVTEEGCIVALFSLRRLVLGRILVDRLVLAITASILAAEIEGHENTKGGAHCEHADQDRVASGVLRAVFAQIDKSRDNATKVS